MKLIRTSMPHQLIDKSLPFWDNYDLRNNPLYVNMVQTELNNVLRARGHVSLNEVFDDLGIERTILGGQMGWIRDVDPSVGDGYIDFGIWAEGFDRGKDWVLGNLDVMMLYFNVDRVTISMPRRIKKLREEGRIV